jgi:hypothetical protein
VIGWFGLWCLMPLSTINISVIISWQSVLLVEETGAPEKTTNLSQVIAEQLMFRFIHLTKYMITFTPLRWGRHGHDRMVVGFTTT